MNSSNTLTDAPTATTPKTTAIRPRFRTTEDSDGAILTVALPGVNKQDLKLTVLESDLKIEASRSDTVPSDWTTHRATSELGDYALHVRLGERYDGSRSHATLESGVLTLRIPLREEAKPRQIAVN
jgi:HSP20 family protein